jgi:hypothetical protein
MSMHINTKIKMFAYILLLQNFLDLLHKLYNTHVEDAFCKMAA